MKLSRLLLAGGIAMPLLYFGTVAVAGLFYPGYDNIARAPSELGAAGAPYPQIFNLGMVATSVAALAGAAGLVVGLRQLGSGVFLSVLTGASLALLGVSTAMSGLFPLPGPLHYGFGLTAAGLLTPLFGALALRPRGGAVRWVLLLAFVAGVALLAINLGAGGLVSASNTGLWLRALALACFPAIGLLCWEAKRLVERRSGEPS
jgi:hypothetical protein